MNAWESNSKLRKGVKEREVFDPNNLHHLEELRYFKVFNKWRNGCPFELEWPYLDIPTLIGEKFIINVLSGMKLPKRK